MSKKMKGADLYSTTPHGVGAYEDNRARLKYQTLMQDYHELQKDTAITRSRLESGKQKKMVLDAEVRFLRRRFRYMVKAKTVNSSLEEKLAQPSNLHKQSKQTEKLGRKEAAHRMLPPIPEIRPKKKQCVNREGALYGTSSFSQQRVKFSEAGKESSTISDFGHGARVDTRKKNPVRKKAPFFDLNKKERTYANDAAPSNASPGFDLNQDGFSGRESSSLPSRAPVFDLNEISTGDDDIQTFAEETRSNLLRHDEMQNDVMLSVCRNAGEGQSRVGKRKISWQDQVALRV